jgi:hypothetical protein
MWRKRRNGLLGLAKVGVGTSEENQKREGENNIHSRKNMLCVLLHYNNNESENLFSDSRMEKLDVISGSSLSFLFVPVTSPFCFGRAL